MPTGPLNRVADNTLAKNLLGWEPKIKFSDGLRATIEWYYSIQDRDKSRGDFGSIVDREITH